MKKGLRWKIILTVAILAAAIIAATPLKDKLHLGLDLKGGIHLVMQVLTDDAIAAGTEQEILRFTDVFKKNAVTFQTASKDAPGKFTFLGINPDQEAKVRELIDQYTTEWTYSFTADKVTFTVKPLAADGMRDSAVVQTLETIRNRVDTFGVAEPLIQRQGADRLVVELPGVDDPERVKDIIKVTAVLKWQLVMAGPAADEATLLTPYNGVLPPDGEILKGDAKRGHSGVYLVEKVAAVTGKDLRMVRRGQDEWNNPAVSFQLNSDGATRFEQITGANINKALAIVLDNKVLSAPNINARISDSGIIQGGFTVESADDLVTVLKAGALPAGIRYLEERTIGPALGSDSIRQGLIAGLAAIVAVMAFMVIFYKLAGVNAVLAMIMNVVILMGALSYLKASLTLPGIAGIILSIGMAVDANVLIFERMKEERALGKSVFNSISLGFEKAFSAIFDSNLTTIISAVILLQFGTGPIKGYAWTLMIGLLANMFTAVFVSRVMFETVIPTTAKKLSI